MAVVRFFYEEDMRKRFLPLTHLKGVEDLRSGIYTFARRIELGQRARRRRATYLRGERTTAPRSGAI